MLPSKTRPIYQPPSNHGTGGIQFFAILAVSFLVYAPALRGEFVWDDFDLGENPLLRTAGGLWKIWFHPSANAREAHYWPLVYTSFWLDKHLWNLNPLGSHLVNVFLHGMNSVLFFHLLRRLEIQGSWISAMLFALHPVHVESVAWIVERKDVLCGAFYIGALSAFLRWERKGRGSDYGISLALFLCAMLSKSSAVSFPVALALVMSRKAISKGADWISRTGHLGTMLAWLPFFIFGMAIGYADANYARGHDVLNFSPPTFAERIAIAGRAVWFYILKLLWPANLMPVYPRWQLSASSMGFWLFPVTLCGLFVAAGFFMWGMNRSGLAILSFYGLSLAPTLGLVDFGFMRFSFVADRFQYLPSLGGITLLGMGMDKVIRVFRSSCRESKKCAYWLLQTAPLCAMGILSWNRASDYKNLETLFRGNAAKNPSAWIAFYNVGIALNRDGKADEATGFFDKAIAIKPDFSEALNMRGEGLVRRGDIDGAGTFFARAVASDGTNVKALNNLGSVCLRQRKIAEAIGFLQRALEVNPNFADAHFNLGFARLQESKTDEALMCAERAVALDPRHAEAFNLIGVILAQRGDMPEATRNFSSALAIRPDFAEARTNLNKARALQNPSNGSMRIP